jgi:protein ImuB
VDRTACIDLPAFPLQLLLKRNAEWRAHPAAVVAEDKPQGLVSWVNEKARASGVLSGMRYAAALALAPGLRAGVVQDGEIAAAVAELTERLRQFTPRVEPAAGEPGVFWLDARGLERLFGSLDAWTAQVHADLVRAGFVASLVAGFGRFGSYALARSRRGACVLKTPGEEREAARAVRLDRLHLQAGARDALAKLGVTTVGAFVDLPLEGVGTRFGPETHRLHRLASGDVALPLQPDRPQPPAQRRLILDHPDADAQRLVASIEVQLDGMLDEIGKKGRALAGLQIVFRFERLGDHVETLKPAAPTLSLKRVMELVRLRLEAVRTLPDRVAELVLVAGESEPLPRQERLFAVRGRRSLDAADRALARVRAKLGDESVVRAAPRDGHLPEARFAWERLGEMVAPRPRPVDEPRLVRRFHPIPVPLPPRERHEPDGWMLRGLEQGPVVRVLGPYAISGGWWDKPAARDYHFAETKDGELLWVFYDRQHRRWFLQGRVE